MWLDKYQNLSTIDKERFSELANELLNRNYILAHHYDNKNRSRRPNSGYNFIIRNYEIFEEYFKLANYIIARDDDRQVISLYNENGFNHLRIDKFTTLFLFTLRIMYEETIEKVSSSDVIYTTTSQILYKMLELGLVVKKPTIKDTVEVLRFALSHNIICRLDKTIDNFEAQIAILPSILLVVSSEKVNAIYQLMLGKNEEVEA